MPSFIKCFRYQWYCSIFSLVRKYKKTLSYAPFLTAWPAYLRCFALPSSRSTRVAEPQCSIRVHCRSVPRQTRAPPTARRTTGRTRLCLPGRPSPRPKHREEKSPGPLSGQVLHCLETPTTVHRPRHTNWRTSASPMLGTSSTWCWQTLTRVVRHPLARDQKACQQIYPRQARWC